MSTANNKVLRNRRLKNSAGHTCADFAKTFVDATRNRRAEIVTIREVMAICQKRFGQLPNDLVTYLNQVKNQFKVYVNSTVFIRYVAYVEKHIADNIYGKSLASQGRRYQPNKARAVGLARKNVKRLTRKF